MVTLPFSVVAVVLTTSSPAPTRLNTTSESMPMAKKASSRLIDTPVDASAADG